MSKKKRRNTLLYAEGNAKQDSVTEQTDTEMTINQNVIHQLLPHVCIAVLYVCLARIPMQVNDREKDTQVYVEGVKWEEEASDGKES